MAGMTEHRLVSLSAGAVGSIVGVTLLVATEWWTLLCVILALASYLLSGAFFILWGQAYHKVVVEEQSEAQRRLEGLQRLQAMWFYNQKDN